MAEKTLEMSSLTLVRYNNPTLVIKHEDKKGDKEVSHVSGNIVKSLTSFSNDRKFRRVRKTDDQVQVPLVTQEKKLKRF